MDRRPKTASAPAKLQPAPVKSILSLTRCLQGKRPSAGIEYRYGLGILESVPLVRGYEPLVRQFRRIAVRGYGAL